ncbi:SDR family NAD(P)-dependent oxidoreductase [Frateuria aurantia]
MSVQRPLSLVTGASAGIGLAFAQALAARGHDLVLTARRQPQLEQLAATLRAQHGCEVTVLVADLADPGAAVQLEAALRARDLHVDWLINNAGYGLPGHFVQSGWEQHAAFLQVLVTAPTELAWRLLPGMRARGRGAIINVASLAGFAPGTAGHTLYAAAKAYMIKFSQSLALENQARGIKVCALCPGFTYSEFHDVTGTRALMNKMPTYMWQTADEVVAEALEALDRGETVRVTGRVNRLIKAVLKLLPDRLTEKLAAGQSKRYRAQHVE